MFKIEEIQKTKDGGVELEIIFDDDFADQVKKGHGWKRLTKARLEWFINNALLKYADEKESTLEK
tara:strand:- start:308 stop:502 length:195 start_codon:yes stop_codon:yes gene_type:complete